MLPRRFFASMCFIFVLAGCGANQQATQQADIDAKLETVAAALADPTAPPAVPTATDIPKPTNTPGPTNTPRPTRTPAPTKQPVPSGVLTQDATLYRGPSVNFPVAGEVKAGKKVVLVTSRVDADVLWIKINSAGKVGWVEGSMLTIDPVVIAALPIDAEVLETPVPITPTETPAPTPDLQVLSDDAFLEYLTTEFRMMGTYELQFVSTEIEDRTRSGVEDYVIHLYISDDTYDYLYKNDTTSDRDVWIRQVLPAVKQHWPDTDVDVRLVHRERSRNYHDENCFYTDDNNDNITADGWWNFTIFARGSFYPSSNSKDNFLCTS